MSRFFIFAILITMTLTSCTKDESLVKSNQSFNERTSGNLPINLVKAIVVENQTGPVIIEGTTNQSNIGWFLDKHVVAESNDAANNIFSKIRINLQTINDTAYITVEIPPAANSNNTLLSLNAPNNIPAILRKVDGSSNVSYLQTSFIGENITLTNIVGHNGNCILTGINQEATVEISLPENGLCKIIFNVGNITLKIPSATSSMLSLQTGDGAIFTSGITIYDSIRTSNYLSGKLGTGNGTIELITGSGNISIEGF